jgi:membrane protein implicated in regulation of membrane protease activity
MLVHFLIFALTILAILGSYLSDEPWRTIGTIIALSGPTISLWWSLRQEKENRRLTSQVNELEGRTKVEDSSAPGVLGQGELATWSYAQLVNRLRLDRYIQ